MNVHSRCLSATSLELPNLYGITLLPLRAGNNPIHVMWFQEAKHSQKDIGTIDMLHLPMVIDALGGDYTVWAIVAPQDFQKLADLYAFLSSGVCNALVRGLQRLQKGPKRHNLLPYAKAKVLPKSSYFGNNRLFYF
mmetsp:Transcript_1555/g.2009  ORF Transcript_1555/g.2009 Transcript_1555/m.2009 type:complete len:136 (+) Transcript_1555:848-1255(+)